MKHREAACNIGPRHGFEDQDSVSSGVFVVKICFIFPRFFGIFMDHWRTFVWDNLGCLGLNFPRAILGQGTPEDTKTQCRFAALCFNFFREICRNFSGSEYIFVADFWAHFCVIFLAGIFGGYSGQDFFCGQDFRDFGEEPIPFQHLSEGDPSRFSTFRRHRIKKGFQKPGGLGSRAEKDGFRRDAMQHLLMPHVPLCIPVEKLKRALQ